jgi:hypothetical protein
VNCSFVGRSAGTPAAARTAIEGAPGGGQETGGHIEKANSDELEELKIEARQLKGENWKY